MLILLSINPIPWTSGTLGIKRINGRLVPMIFKDAGLKMYQEAVRSNIDPAVIAQAIDPPYRITFYLWRALEQADVGTDRKRRAHQSDATNMQKALEDALQGTVIGNDRDVDDIRTVIMDQGPEVIPGIIIEITDSLAKLTWSDDVVYGRSEILKRYKAGPSDNTHITEEMF